MKFITGDECGLIKVCSLSHALKEKAGTNTKFSPSASFVVHDSNNNKGESSNNKTQTVRCINSIEHASRRHGVISIVWNEPGADKSFSSLHVDGGVLVWEQSSSLSYRNNDAITNVFGQDNANIDALSRPMKLSRISMNGGHRLCACNHSGKVVLLNPKEDKEDQIVSSFETLGATQDHNENKRLYPYASAMAVSEALRSVAVGGKDRETVLFDLETHKQVWKTKNLPPDAQTLLQPQIWPTAIEFLHNTTSEVLGWGDPNLLAVGTAYAQVRLYDVRLGGSHQRRPVRTTRQGFLEHRVTAMCQSRKSPYELIVGDAAGFAHALDMRKLVAPSDVRVKERLIQLEQVGTHGRFVGPAGSIRQLVQANSLLGVVGLDRMLRVYDSSRRKEMVCFYLKQRLNCLLIGQEEDDIDAGLLEDAVLNSRSKLGGKRENDDYGDYDIDQDDVVDEYIDSDASVNEQEDDDGSASESEESSQSDPNEDTGSDDSSTSSNHDDEDAGDDHDHVDDSYSDGGDTKRVSTQSNKKRRKR